MLQAYASLQYNKYIVGGDVFYITKAKPKCFSNILAWLYFIRNISVFWTQIQKVD